MNHTIKLNRLKEKYEKEKEKILKEAGLEIGNMIKEKSINISKMAKALGISRTVIYYIMRGERTISKETIEKIMGYINRR